MRTHGKMRKRRSLTLVLAMIVSITSLLWTMPGREAHAATQAELMHTANDRLVDNPAAETRPGQWTSSTLNNVHHRFLIQAGEPHGLRIASKKGKGKIIRIIAPYLT